jgi:uncharacterized membrane protein
VAMEILTGLLPWFIALAVLVIFFYYEAIYKRKKRNNLDKE